MMVTVVNIIPAIHQHDNSVLLKAPLCPMYSCTELLTWLWTLDLVLLLILY